MGSFNQIQQKLRDFIKKYYTNELIRGLIMFSAFGLLYFIFTLFIEYFLWLQPSARSVLFFVFIGVELALMVRFIVYPIFKLLGLQTRISFEDASRIIGNHFLEVDDKLLNVLQLNKSENTSELFLASIEQKASQLQPIPFKTAIKFSSNRKYLKYLAIPLLIWGFTFISGNNGLFKESFTRVVNYQTAYEPPAPFSFKVLNDKLSLVEGKPYVLRINTEGSLIPENAQIFFNEENYFLKQTGNGSFEYRFENLDQPINFYLSANGVRSKAYRLDIIKTPVVTGLKMVLDYPNYTKKRNETINNTGNAIIPEGTKVTWSIVTRETDSINFMGDVNDNFTKMSDTEFSLSKRVRNNLSYQINTSNANLKNYEQLNYNIQVIKDGYPKIIVQSDIDSVTRGPVQFTGQLSDDYGLSKFQLVYYDIEQKDSLNRHAITINKSSFEEFYYAMIPGENVQLQPGKDYEMYFEVFDNDGVNGNKSVKSKIFKYHNKTQQELSDDLLREQKESLDNLDKTAKNTDKLNKEFKEFTDKLKKKSNLEWNDKKEFEKFLERQEQYQEMFEKQTDKLKENLDELNENDETIRDKKEELQKRIEETKELQKKDKLLEELRKLAEKLDKEDLIEKLDKLAEQQKQEKRSLERLLELTKRFYVEKKANDIAKKLEELAKKQEALSEEDQKDADKQKQLNEEFDKIQKDLEELREQNQKLRDPMSIPDLKREEEQVDELQQRAKESIEQNSSNETNDEQKNNDSKKASKMYQKSAAKKMQQMSQQMQGAMSAMQGEMMQENIEALRAILENLVTFSLDQEALMLSLDGVDAGHPLFPKKIKKQQLLKEHFEHIDDSLYVLSMRQQKLSAKIQKDITDAHYNIDKSLENIAENRMNRGISNQQYTMTAANNLADMLSDMLNSMQNPSFGQGQGKSQNDFQLPDIIKRQEELKGKMEKGMQPKEQDGKEGEQNGEGEKRSGKSKEQLTGEQYELYQQQQELRQRLENLLNQEEEEGEAGKQGSEGEKALEMMKQLEEQLLDKGFTNETLQNMIQLEYELLKLKDARLKQGKDSKRESSTNKRDFKDRVIKQLQLRKDYLILQEILNREPLPLRNQYKIKVQEYFKSTND